MTNENIDNPHVPLSQVINLLERVKGELIANYPHDADMFFLFGANQKAVARIDSWILDQGVEARAMKVRTDNGGAVVLGPVRLER